MCNDSRMSLPSNDTTQPTPGRSSRRTRRLAIVGVLALVLVGGIAIVAATTNGARSGSITSAGFTCVTDSNGTSVEWTDNADLTGGTFTVNAVTSTRITYTGTMPGKSANSKYTSTTAFKTPASFMINGTIFTFTITYKPSGVGQSPTLYGTSNCSA